MNRLTLSALLLGATALTMPLSSALAQDQDSACADLQRLIQEAEADNFDLVKPFENAPAVAEANVNEECALYIAEIDKAGGITAEAQQQAQAEGTATETETETFRETERLTETVEIEQQAVVAGKVLVRSEVPQVEVKQKAPEVEVREGTVDVDIDEQPANITVRQQPSTVRVSIPRPTVTIEQPAPEILVEMPPPGVNINRNEPRVSMRMPDPEVTVTQADPTVDVQVQAEFVEPGQLEQMSEEERPQVVTQTERRDSQGNVVSADQQAEVSVSQEQGTARFISTDEDNNVRYQRARPTIRYEAAEPNVEISYADEPRVEVRQVGEPTVRMSRPGQDGEQQGQQQAAQQQGDQQQGQQQATQQQGGQQQQGDQQQQATQQQGDQQVTLQENERVGEEALESFIEDQDRPEGQDMDRDQGQERMALDQQQTSDLLRAPEEGATATSMMTMTVADIEGRDVMTLNGDEVGEIGRVVENNGQVYAIIEHGGFLGIGQDEVAVPASRIALRGNEAVLLGLSESQLEMMPEYNVETENLMAATDQVEIGSME